MTLPMSSYVMKIDRMLSPLVTGIVSTVHIQITMRADHNVSGYREPNPPYAHLSDIVTVEFYLCVKCDSAAEAT